ncbi:MAG: hypothetical protein KF749_03770 [Bacteroidetes bacterium]|nr:hypothetical protein [Bacteroidota bacterium]MCW5897515.1 hypothetical protein [Bacteroidota bacterium]
MSNFPIEAPDDLTRTTINFKNCFIRDPQSGGFLTLSGDAKDGTNLILSEFTGNDNQKFLLKYYQGRGWSLATKLNEWQVVCTSRSDYSSDRQYKEPGHPLWLWTWMNGGNQFWDLSKRYQPNSFVITNTHSGIHMYADGVKGRKITQDHKEVRWEVFPESATLRLLEVKCIRPASGIDIGVNNLVAEISTGIGFALGGVGLAAVGASPIIGVSVGGAAFVVGAVSLGSWIATKIDANRAPDNLYININGQKVWPANKNYEDVKGGQTVSPNLEISKSIGKHRVQLWDYDNNPIQGRNDDLIGEITFDLGLLTPKGKHEVVVASASEDSIYLLTFLVT